MCRTGTRRGAPRRRQAGSTAGVAPTRIGERGAPELLGLWLGIGQRRPVCGARFLLPPGVPGRYPAVEIARLVHLVGRGRELVDDGGVQDVLALLRALDVTGVAAPRAEEIALQPLAVRAAPTAAFRDERRASSAATGGPAVEARLAARVPATVGLTGAFPATARLAARFGFFAQDGVRNEARWQSATPLSEMLGAWSLTANRGIAPVASLGSIGERGA